MCGSDKDVEVCNDPIKSIKPIEPIQPIDPLQSGVCAVCGGNGGGVNDFTEQCNGTGIDYDKS